MKCFYHSADLDGHCSGAIVKYFEPECEMIGINYGDDFPWESIEPGEKVFMVDFSLQPFDDMERLSKCCKLIWIDHHRTAIDEANKRNFLPFDQLIQDGIGACALTWQYFSGIDIPECVQLLAEYDVWNHENPLTLPFQYGMRLRHTKPDYDGMSDIWDHMLREDSRLYFNYIIEEGRTCIKYEKVQSEKFCQAFAYETKVHQDVGLPTYRCYHAIVINRGMCNSKVFDSVYDPELHDIMISYVFKKGQWTISLYSDKNEVDCGAIAKENGGGGHKGAAGFQCKKLPLYLTLPSEPDQ